MRLLRRASLPLLTITMVVLGAGTAHASGGVTIGWASPVGAPEAPQQSATFGSLAEAVFAGSGGTIRLEPDATVTDLVRIVRSLERASLSSAADTSTLSTVLIGIDYDGAGYTGEYYLWFASGSGCSDGTNYYASTMPAGWDNRVSSALSFNGCNSYKHFDGTYQAGSSVTCPCSSMGFMNNRTSSERWSP